jgi:UDP:flavonoid glycosyltransferase YjiC (YdhE family)
MYHGHDFFVASVQACHRLNRRGLLLSRHPDQIPKSLPPAIRHFAYVPFSRVLPAAAALVHHGGIGTSAQALAAGCPQLVTPFAHDQFDNADRIVRLGVGRSITAGKYTAKSAAAELSRLLSAPRVTTQCRAIADRLRSDDAVGRTCHLIEELAVNQAAFT